MVLIVILLILLILLLQCRTKKDYFSPSNKPVGQENTLLMNSVIDDIDYITPVFIRE
jgi:hypothetical protein